MAYSTYTEVQSEFKDITFSSSTKITDTEVTRFITEADAYINSRIGKRYTIPIDSTNNPVSFSIVRSISIWLVSDRIRNILQVKSISVDDLKQGIRPPYGRADAEKMLDRIVKGEIDLYDSTEKSSAQGVSSFAVDNDSEFTFDKDKDQW